jgi:hypothetical protein
MKFKPGDVVTCPGNIVWGKEYMIVVKISQPSLDGETVVICTHPNLYIGGFYADKLELANLTKLEKVIYNI